MAKLRPEDPRHPPVGTDGLRDASSPDSRRGLFLRMVRVATLPGPPQPPFLLPLASGRGPSPLPALPARLPPRGPRRSLRPGPGSRRPLPCPRSCSCAPAPGLLFVRAPAVPSLSPSRLVDPKGLERRTSIRSQPSVQEVHRITLSPGSAVPSPARSLRTFDCQSLLSCQEVSCMGFRALQRRIVAGREGRGGGT